jgi:diguanylate cyclase (GGDEF)-like protein
MTPVQVVQNLDVYLFGIAILVLIGIKTASSPTRKSPQSLAFSILAVLNFLIIITDCVTVFFDGKQGPIIRIVLMAAMVLGYILQILICLFWFWYARILVFSAQKIEQIETVFQAIPALVSILTAIISCWTGWVFRFTDENVYRRGPLFIVIVSVSYLYVICGYYMIIRYRKNIQKRHLSALLSFALPPTIAGVLQTFLYGTSLIWSSTTISLLIIYLAIQNEQLLLDYLTGTNNRMSFDDELKRRISNVTWSKPFAVMLIDLDNFKNINDRFGHLEGDEALKSVAKLLTNTFQQSGFVARYSGDEFAVIVDLKTVDELSAIRERLWTTLAEWNATSNKRWKLAMSMGSAPYIMADGLSADNFLVKIDKLLCLDKIVPGERRFMGGRIR